MSYDNVLEIPSWKDGIEFDDKIQKKGTCKRNVFSFYKPRIYVFHKLDMDGTGELLQFHMLLDGKYNNIES